MILFFKKGERGGIYTTAIVDYTRSDDQYSRVQILETALSVGTEITKSVINGANLKIFSLSYQIHYKHSGVVVGNSLKSVCEMSIDNAPAELTSLINLQAVTGQESVLSLEAAQEKILDAQVQFPYCAIVLKTAPHLRSEKIIRSFIAYGMDYNHDSRRVNSSLNIRGANFDSMVMKLNFAADIKKSLPLVFQLQNLFAKSDIYVTSDKSILTSKPVVDRYYPPAPVNRILDQICKDNGLFYDLEDQDKTITIKALGKGDAPRSTLYTSKFCFRGQVPGAKIIGPFNLKDYATIVFETELEDVKLFDTVSIFDDSGTDGQFGSFRKSGETRLKGTKVLYGYDFYILQYELMDSRIKTTVRITATNNWLVSNFKLDTFLENAVYRGVTL